MTLIRWSHEAVLLKMWRTFAKRNFSVPKLVICELPDSYNILYYNILSYKQIYWQIYFLCDNISPRQMLTHLILLIISCRCCFIIWLYSCFLCTDHWSLYGFGLSCSGTPSHLCTLFLNLSLSTICLRFMFTFRRSFLVYFTHLVVLFSIGVMLCICFISLVARNLCMCL